MLFEDKLRLRDKALQDFAKAGQASSLQILKAGFCEFDDLSPSVIRTDFDRMVAIKTYRIPRQTQIGQKEGFFSELLPDRIFINSANLKNSFFHGSVLRHEHVHYLQYHVGMSCFSMLNFNDVSRKFKNSRDGGDCTAADQIVYLSDEAELMPRLDQIISTFSGMGGKMPMAQKEFEAFLWLCEIGTRTQDDADHKTVGRTLMPELSDQEELASCIRLFFDYCHNEIREIQIMVTALKPLSRPRAMELLNSAYVKLLNLYGYDITTKQFADLPQARLTCDAMPILSAR